MKPVNTLCRLAARPTGLPNATHFTLVATKLPTRAQD
jgi:hypothetical protein